MGLGQPGGLQSSGSSVGSSPTFSGVVTALEFVSTQASGADGFLLNTAGARLQLSSTGTTDYLTSNGTTQITAAGVFGVSGNLNLGTTAGTSFVVPQISTANCGATTPAVMIVPAQALDATDTLFATGTTGGSMVGIAVAGSGKTNFVGDVSTGTSTDLLLGRALILSSFTDDSATPGNRTVNKQRGKNAFAIAASTCVITNSQVAATSQVICTLEFVDATLTAILSCIPSAGSFTVTGNAVAAAATKFSWTVIS